jgi:hypothetical protein
MSSIILIEILMLCFVIITLPLYIMILFLLKKSSDGLDPAFRYLSISLGTADILSFFNNYFGSQLPRWKLFPRFYLTNRYVMAKIFSLPTWSLPMLQTLSLLLLALSRFSTVAFQLKYDQVFIVFL